MLLIIDSSLPTLAEDVFEEALVSYNYDSKSKYGTAVDRLDLTPVESSDLTVITLNTSELIASSNYRRTVLDVMSKGGLIVVPTDTEVDASVSVVVSVTGQADQVDNLIVAGRYAEERAKFFASTFPKVDYVGPTYEDPMAVVILPHKEEEGTDVRKEIIDSLTPDFWGYITFVSAQRKESIGKLLDHLEFSAVLVLDKKMEKRVESFGRPVHVIGTPDGTETYGKLIRNTVKTQE